MSKLVNRLSESSLRCIAAGAGALAAIYASPASAQELRFSREIEANMLIPAATHDAYFANLSCSKPKDGFIFTKVHKDGRPSMQIGITYACLEGLSGASGLYVPSDSVAFASRATPTTSPIADSNPRAAQQSACNRTGTSFSEYALTDLLQTNRGVVYICQDGKSIEAKGLLKKFKGGDVNIHVTGALTGDGGAEYKFQAWPKRFGISLPFAKVTYACKSYPGGEFVCK